MDNNEQSQITVVNNLPADPFEMMDRMDDKLILAEIEGRVVDAWVYHFPGDDGREQWGLSKVGVDAACAEIAKKGEVIRELEITYQVDPIDSEYILFVSKAGRYAVSKTGKEVLLDTAIGTKRQWTKLLKKNGDKIVNKFYFEQGAMKALRNARSRLLSEDVKTKIISFAKSKNKTMAIVSDQAVVAKTEVATQVPPANMNRTNNDKAATDKQLEYIEKNFKWKNLDLQEFESKFKPITALSIGEAKKMLDVLFDKTKTPTVEDLLNLFAEDAG